MIFVDDVDVSIETLTERQSALRPSLWIIWKRPYDDDVDNFDWSTLVGIETLYGGYSDSEMTYRPDGSRVTAEILSVPNQIMKVPAAWARQIFPPLERLVDAGLLNKHRSQFIVSLFAMSVARLPDVLFTRPLGRTQKGRSALGEVLLENSTYYLVDEALKIPQNRWFGSSIEEHNLLQANKSDIEGKYMLRFDLASRGYAYHIDRPAKVIAIIILSAYCLYTLTFIAITLSINRVHSNSWDTLAELTALAMLSKPTTRLRNTSAGIETVELFKEPVNIRAVDQDHLEIVFENDCGDRAVQPIQRDAKY